MEKNLRFEASHHQQLEEIFNLIDGSNDGKRRRVLLLPLETDDVERQEAQAVAVPGMQPVSGT